MQRSTMPSMEQTRELAALVREHCQGRLPAAGSRRVGLFWSVRITLLWLRTNLTQEMLTLMLPRQVSQPTVCRIITAYTELIAHATQGAVPTADDLDPATQLLIDGTLLPCWSWRTEPGLWSGKHKTTGLNIQVACTLDGRLAWVSDPLPGSTHDVTALRASGLLDTEHTTLHLADRGYQGTVLLTPIKKRPGQPLNDHDRAFNASLNRIRATVERVIANLKTWRVLHTDYRRPHATHATTLTAILGIIFTYHLI